ncbi:MAG TPA: hypothetical protein VMU57_16490 [Edaphobacter sp.]|uniref:hypothetical protein n=1 Tax=Edaphobacter sp. TaxID=1934404 RepID=UPI002BC2CA50|nr:hypothetical protein [Edaphobacter sp.]HUZ96502.1 hypothetical protein [Edaphobacter sp.]
MQITSALYKFAYCVTLVIILAILLQGVPFGSVTTTPKALLLWAYVAVVILTGVVAVVFRRLSRSFVWGVVGIFCAFFTWQNWFGPGGFFIQTETHSFDPTAAAAESARFNRQAAISYVVIMIWFLSLPLLRQFSRRTGAKNLGAAVPPKPQ